MSEYRGVLLDTDTFGIDDLSLDAIYGLPVSWQNYPATSPEQVSGRLHNAHFVITNKAPIGVQQLAVAPHLKMIAVAATGTNVIDLDAARDAGVAVSNCVAYGSNSVVQHTMALLLALSTRVVDYHRDVMAGAWQRSPMFCRLDYPVEELAGKTLGIVGFGELGRGVARIAEAFGMTVKVASLPGREQPGRTPLAELLPQLDVLSLHCPLTEQTRNLIGANELAAMKSSALLLNVARGGIVHEQALVDALRNGDIAGAGVDVLTQEPPVDGNPLLAGDIPNLIVTPHSAWISRRARQTLLDQVAENIQSFLDGEPKRLV
ncbi:2-hydroxyacid dehydrogenase [Porticoccus sp. W117]|uniref:2-hydroxyacid dehydrogenase n=1 Tax=Porticoccus sp. W117 TaxID=3054777 RepID=UPI002596BC25|nr:2-hydroxyacid dehydrogenase [Porticoccus sp. W117]MDM3871486.1 2-hydroxyacid dehydrogenase [Porticoccus sp. W117]